MTYYARILPWENTNRLDRLTEFRSLVCEYFDNSRGSWEAGIRVEEPLALEAREKINRIMNEIQRIIFYAGVQTVVQYIPPAVTGGYIQNIDLIENIFNLFTYKIPQNRLIDSVDRAIGVYENNKLPAFLRAINPFFYIGLLLDLIVRFPFVLIERAGFDGQKAESSLIGRAIKAIFYIISLLAALLTVLQLLDYLEPVKEVVKSILSER